MTSVAQKCLEFGCDELFRRGDDLGCGFRKSLLRANLDGVGRETQPLDGHPHGSGRGRHDHKSVSDAAELSVVDEQVIDVLENNFFQIGSVEGVALVLAHCTSPDARVHSRCDDDRNITRVESNRFRDACAQFDKNQKDSAAQAFLELVDGSQSSTCNTQFLPCEGIA